MEPKKLAGILLLGALAFWIIGWASSRSHKSVAPQVVQASPTDKWHVTEDKSPMDDSRTVALALDSDDEVRGPLGQVRPSLIVRCQEKKTDVYITTGMAANVEADGEHVVGIRLDDGAARHENWSESTDHTALFASDIIWNNHEPTFQGGRIEFAKRLAGASQLTFQFTPFDGSPQVARFDLRGLDIHLHDVAEACGWAY
jgi:Type VI secretion system VasI, EvfG, VC_A0118